MIVCKYETFISSSIIFPREPSHYINFKTGELFPDIFWNTKQNKTKNQKNPENLDNFEYSDGFWGIHQKHDP